MKTLVVFLVPLILWATSVQAYGRGCRDDICARYVTKIDHGVEGRRSQCSSILGATMEPNPVLVTTTTTMIVTTIPLENRDVGAGDFITTPPPPDEPFPTEGFGPRAEPDNQGWGWLHCPLPGQFSSACRCWAEITPVTTTLPTATLTVTSTSLLNAGCSPVATAVSGSSRFACSGNQPGMCTCLQPNNNFFFAAPAPVVARAGSSASPLPAGVGLCVRVAAGLETTPGWGANVTGPCAAQSECAVDGGCPVDGQACVFDGSCTCGTRRCYVVVPGGCDLRAQPVHEVERRRRALAKRARDYL